MATPETDRGLQREQVTETPIQPTATPDIVRQPLKVEFATLLDDIDSKISEAQSTGPGEQWSSGGTVQSGQTGGDDGRMSARDLAIANAPAPVIMQKQLEQHILDEIKDLRKQAKKIERESMKKQGAAYRLHILNGKIRQLRKLLADLKEISVDAIKRLFVRVFIDKQKIVK